MIIQLADFFFLSRRGVVLLKRNWITDLETMCGGNCHSRNYLEYGELCGLTVTTTFRERYNFIALMTLFQILLLSSSFLSPKDLLLPFNNNLLFSRCSWCWWISHLLQPFLHLISAALLSWSLNDILRYSNIWLGVTFRSTQRILYRYLSTSIGALPVIGVTLLSHSIEPCGMPTQTLRFVRRILTKKKNLTTKTAWSDIF